jgi:ATP-binding cassette subfamily F protein 3
LLAYKGTLVLVAHDRYILDRLPEEIIEVGAGTAVRYLGNYEEYLSKKAAGDASPPPAPHAGVAREHGRLSAPPSHIDRGAQRRREREEVRRAQQRAQLEAAISEKEAELSALTVTLNQPDFHQTHSNPHSLYSDYARLRKEIETLYAQLERLEGVTADALAS